MIRPEATDSPKLTKLSSTRLRPACSTSISIAARPFDDGDGAGAEFAVEDAQVALLSVLEQLRMRAGSLEHDASTFSSLVVDFVDQQKISADVAFTVSGPFAPERVVEPLGAERGIVGDEDEHRFLEAIHVVAARPRQPFKILLKSPGVIAGAGEGRALGRGLSHPGWRSVRRRFRTAPCARAGWRDLRPSPHGFRRWAP